MTEFRPWAVRSARTALGGVTGRLLWVWIASCAGGAMGAPDGLALSVRRAPEATQTVDLPAGVSVDENFECTVFLAPVTNSWLEVGAVSIGMVPPTHAPADVQALFFMEDRDGHWFQRLFDGPLVPGVTNQLVFSLEPAMQNSDWESVNHYGVWNFRSRLEPRQAGVRLFRAGAWSGTCQVVSLEGRPAQVPESPPAIEKLTPFSMEVGVHACFEASFRLPDRYANPFDPDEIDAWAEVVGPTGGVTRVDAFYYQEYFRRTNRVADVFVPRGRPHWRFRFAPRIAGEYRYRLHAVDALGQTRTPPHRFSAVEFPDRMPYIRVSEKDPRFFEGDDGSPFFPIGHNIRSPFDTRMDGQFPWKFRHPEGSSAYRRYFAEMEAAGENITEVWMCSWSLGLEWSRDFPGYHGLNDYNLVHAWELDEVLDEAFQRGIYVNLSLNNHGKLSSFCDAEWEYNPMNSANGGYLDEPLDFFVNARAREDTLRQLRYIVARWGWNPAIFAWKLWNELDLTGTGKEKPRPHQAPEVMQWLADTAGDLARLDPNNHMTGCHLSGNYTLQNAEMISIEALDFCPVDAYHHSSDPLHIVELNRKTAEFNNPFGKPVLITEFGGSPMGTSLENLKDELRFGLWSSTVIPLSGAPMFWWWGVIEEHDLYPVFRSLALYMQGEDRRDPEMRTVSPTLRSEDGRILGPERVLSLAMTSREQGFGYLVRPDLARSVSGTEAPAIGWNVGIPMPGEDVYEVTFWDIDHARPAAALEARAGQGSLSFPVPEFKLDLAFKWKRMPGGITRDPESGSENSDG